MTTARELRTASRDELRAHILSGYPVDPTAVEGWVYRGTSLGLPGWVERLTWKTFQKTFYREPQSNRLMGWNVRLEQDGIDAPSRPKMRDHVPVTEWFYEVVDPEGLPMPAGFNRGLMIDYALGPNPPGTVYFTKDPLVSLSPDNADELLGVSYLVIAGRCIETPTYFTLERDHLLNYVPAQIAFGVQSSFRLTGVEMKWAEALFKAILGTERSLPTLSENGTADFFNAFNGSAAPLVVMGLRPMVYTLTFLPVWSGYRRPFHLLTPEEQEAFLVQIDGDRRVFVKQALTTLKTLACFAYFETPETRTFYSSAAAGSAQ
ncbi:MAG: hypothetical protein IPK82_31610 [Polyangiaceae bacterium]|nr:hypothetical protein [Polyangiaceae bacterium]